MNNLTIYIFILMNIFITLAAFGQNTRSTSHNRNVNRKAITQDTTINDEASIIYKISQFKNSIAERNNALKANTKLKDNQKNDMLELSLSECDSIIFYYEKILNEKSDYSTLKSRESAFEIYEFLDRSDVAVFTTDFKKIDVSQLSICHQTRYKLFEEIYLTNNLLLKAINKISDENITKFAKDNSVSQKEAREFLLKSAESDLINADEKMLEIDGMDLSVLSNEQQNFYKQTLIKKYMGIHNQIYPKNN